MSCSTSWRKFQPWECGWNWSAIITIVDQQCRWSLRNCTQPEEEPHSLRNAVDMLMKPITVGGILVKKHLTKFKPRWRLLGLFGLACIWLHEWCIWYAIGALIQSDCTQGIGALTQSDCTQGIGALTQSDCTQGVGVLIQSDCTQGIGALIQSDKIALKVLEH